MSYHLAVVSLQHDILLEEVGNHQLLMVVDESAEFFPQPVMNGMMFTPVKTSCYALPKQGLH